MVSQTDDQLSCIAIDSSRLDLSRTGASLNLKKKRQYFEFKTGHFVVYCRFPEVRIEASSL